MKKLLTSLFVIFLFFSFVFMTSCVKTSNIQNIQKINKGMSATEVKVILGEPILIEFNSEGNTWCYEYYSNGWPMLFKVTIKNDSVKGFDSY